MFWSLNKKRVSRIFRSNFVPGMLALSATAVFLVILAYIFYDINSYHPNSVKMTGMIRGVVEDTEFVPGSNSQTLAEFYQEPEQNYPQPELPQKFFSPDTGAVYRWLELPEPGREKKE